MKRNRHSQKHNNLRKEAEWSRKEVLQFLHNEIEILLII